MTRAGLAVAIPHIECGDCQIRHRAVCARCDRDELDELNRLKYYRVFAPGETIAWAGEEMDFVASVVSGVATLSQTLEDGRRQVVGLLLPSDFVGRPGRPAAAYDVTASTEVLLCCFRKKPFEEMLTRMPHLAQRLLEMMIDELDAAREWMLLLGRKTAREKIASLLAIFARREAMLHRLDIASSGVIRFRLPLSREEMADYLGLTLETVSRHMSALRRDGVIMLEGSRTVIVPDMSRLLCETGDDSDGGLPG